jgi:hypothetical protein
MCLTTGINNNLSTDDTDILERLEKVVMSQLHLVTVSNFSNLTRMSVL